MLKAAAKPREEHATFRTVSRAGREKVLNDLSPRPCVGQYSPKHCVTERYGQGKLRASR